MERADARSIYWFTINRPASELDIPTYICQVAQRSCLASLRGHLRQHVKNIELVHERGTHGFVRKLPPIPQIVIFQVSPQQALITTEEIHMQGGQIVVHITHPGISKID